MPVPDGLFPRVGPVQVLAGRQFCEFLEVLRTQRLGNGMFLVEPFAKINQLAATRTKRAVRAVEPGARFLAGWTFDFRRRVHASCGTKVRTKPRTVQPAAWALPRERRCPICAGARQSFTNSQVGHLRSYDEPPWSDSVEMCLDGFRKREHAPVSRPDESRHACSTHSLCPGRQCRKPCRGRVTCE